MALTLTDAIDATQTDVHVTGTVPDNLGIGSRFRIGDEMVEVRSFGEKEEPWRTGRLLVRDLQAWHVTRGMERSTAASHLSGVAVDAVNDAWLSASGVTPPGPFNGSGGGGSQSLAQTLAIGNAANDSITDLTDPTDPQDAVTKAYVDLALANLLIPTLLEVLTSGDDPGANNIDGSTDWHVGGPNGGSIAFIGNGRVDIRANGGNAAGLSVEANGNVNAASGGFVVDGATAAVTTQALSVGGDFDAASDSLVFAGDGSSGAINTFTLGFFGATPTAQPVVPAVATPQDIVDALVALGLISQAP